MHDPIVEFGWGHQTYMTVFAGFICRGDGKFRGQSAGVEEPLGDTFVELQNPPQRPGNAVFLRPCGNPPHAGDAGKCR